MPHYDEARGIKYKGFRRTGNIAEKANDADIILTYYVFNGFGIKITAIQGTSY